MALAGLPLLVVPVLGAVLLGMVLVSTGTFFAQAIATGYVNTIEPSEEAFCPGNIEIEERLRAYMRWNAMAMVVKANRHHPVDGGDRAATAGPSAANRRARAPSFASLPATSHGRPIDSRAFGPPS